MRGRNYPAIIGWILGTLFALLLAAAMAHATPSGQAGFRRGPQARQGFGPELRAALGPRRIFANCSTWNNFCGLFHVEQLLKA